MSYTTIDPGQVKTNTHSIPRDQFAQVMVISQSAGSLRQKLQSHKSPNSLQIIDTLYSDSHSVRLINLRHRDGRSSDRRVVTHASEPAAVGQYPQRSARYHTCCSTLERVLLADIVAVHADNLVLLDSRLVGGILGREGLESIHGGFSCESTRLYG